MGQAFASNPVKLVHAGGALGRVQRHGSRSAVQEQIEWIWYTVRATTWLAAPRRARRCGCSHVETCVPVPWPPRRVGSLCYLQWSVLYDSELPEHLLHTATLSDCTESEEPFPRASKCRQSLATYLIWTHCMLLPSAESEVLKVNEPRKTSPPHSVLCDLPQLRRSNTDQSFVCP